MSAITSERYKYFGETSFLIKIILLKHFALEVWVSIHICGTSLSTLRSQAWLPSDLVNELPFKVSPVIALDPIKTLYSVA